MPATRTPGHAARGGDQRASQRRDLALGRIAELDVEGHIAAIDTQVLELPRGDEILARVRVHDALERLEERGFIDGHGGAGRGTRGRGV